jgi:hypothetical protein
MVHLILQIGTPECSTSSGLCGNALNRSWLEFFDQCALQVNPSITGRGGVKVVQEFARISRKGREAQALS